MNMQSARTFGKGSLVLGMKSLFMERTVTVKDASGIMNEKKDYPSIVGIPITFGLTDEIDLTAAFYLYNDARSWLYLHDTSSGYGDTERGIGTTRLAAKIRAPFSRDSRIQIASSFGAMLDTSSKMIDGMNYHWTRTGTDIETSLYETISITSSISLHLSQGYVLSGSKIFDDQFVSAAGVSFRIKERSTLHFEIFNRTFRGVSPQSALQAGDDIERYYTLNGVPAAGNPAFLKDNDSDFWQDFMIFSPSAAFRVNDAICLDIGLNINIADQVDPKETLQAIVGITFNTQFTSMVDSDGDGIKNEIDIEQNTPKGFPVDKRGKALDTDKDGVPDGIDREHDTPLGARVDSFGIGIDADKDGVYDGLDKEPQTLKGCPVDRFGVALDDDRDGVPNGIDKEPNSQFGSIVDENGISLDGDGDGVPDGIDIENDTPHGAVVNRSGVSFDKDNDGVPDGIDAEPDTPEGILVDKEGRALIKHEFSLLNKGLMSNNTILFEPGSSELSPDSYHVLDEIGEILKKYPPLKIQIEGHADSNGNKALNMRLARERAKSALKYILEKFPEIDRTRFRVVGYGSVKPTAPNNSYQGRRLNRRVAFVIINKDELLKYYQNK